MAANSLKATFPSLRSTKVSREPILINENEGEKIFRASRGIITRLYVAAFLWQRHRSDLAAQPPHPWGASDGPEYAPNILYLVP